MKNLIVSIRVFALFTLLLGGLYPAAVTLVAQTTMPGRANGSLVYRPDGSVAGSSLIAQEFKSPAYFWARPSAVGYNPLPSGGSNLGPTSKALKEKWDQGRAAGLSGDLLAASASGLDPHIAPESALAQVARVAEARKLSQADVRKLVDAHTENLELGFLGARRVNVLILNQALGALR